MLFAKKGPKIDRGRALTARPEQTPVISSEKHSDGGVTLVVELEAQKWLSWFTRSPTIRRSFRLDKLGTEVYNACDGRTGVRALIKRFGSDHKLSLAEAEMSVTQYLKTLVSKGLIVIAIDREKKEPGDGGA